MKKNLGNILKEFRKKANLTARDVAEKLCNMGYTISDKTLSGYENGIRMPNADIFMALMSIYKCKNILESFSFVEAEYSIPTDDEWDMIEKYRNLDSPGQKRIDYDLSEETKRVEKIRSQQERINQLEQRIVTELVHRIAVPLYGKFASAGSGAYLFDGIPAAMTEVKDTPIARKADFVMGVDGDSMEPDFYDGDKVFVKKTSDLNVGDIGIFLKGENCYIKELGKDRLISHNPDKDNYPDVEADEDMITIGKVIGKVEE